MKSLGGNSINILNFEVFNGVLDGYDTYYKTVFSSWNINKYSMSFIYIMTRRYFELIIYPNFLTIITI
jgi:hypothetical protein